MTLDGARQELLAQVADLVLPPTGRLGGAEPGWFRAVLAADAAVEAGAARALDGLAARREPLEAAVGRLVVAGGPDADALLLVICAGYYGQADVRAAIGYPGPSSQALPPLPDPRDAALEPLLERVRSRGRRYRDISPS